MSDSEQHSGSLLAGFLKYLAGAVTALVAAFVLASPAGPVKGDRPTDILIALGVATYFGFLAIALSNRQMREALFRAVLNSNITIVRAVARATNALIGVEIRTDNTRQSHADLKEEMDEALKRYFGEPTNHSPATVLSAQPERELLATVTAAFEEKIGRHLEAS